MRSTSARRVTLAASGDSDTELTSTALGTRPRRRRKGKSKQQCRAPPETAEGMAGDPRLINFLQVGSANFLQLRSRSKSAR